MTLLLEFCANSMPPSEVPTGPSALLPVPVQTVFHICPAAITPGISVTLYSLCTGGPAAAPRPPPPPPAAAAPPAAAPRPPPPPRGAGGILQLAVTYA